MMDEQFTINTAMGIDEKNCLKETGITNIVELLNYIYAAAFC